MPSSTSAYSAITGARSFLRIEDVVYDHVPLFIEMIELCSRQAGHFLLLLIFHSELYEIAIDAKSESIRILLPVLYQNNTSGAF